MEKKRIYIVGGGASGIMCAYRLKQLEKELDITIFEKNTNTYSDYSNNNYNKISNWQKAMYDPRFHKLITSKDEESRELMVGIGLGGGTLHFGLQYIDQIDILQTSSEFKSDEFKDILLDILIRLRTTAHRELNQYKGRSILPLIFFNSES